MLKTALKPRWILMLILAMAIAAVFVLLSQWQFSSSRDAPPPAPSATENVRPLTEVLQPLTPLYSSTADQMVSLNGSFLSGTRVLVQNRLSDGEDGLWVVEAFAVEGSDGDRAPGDGGAVIPVVLGWVPEADEAAAIEEQQGPASVVGRLLPPEAPEVQRPEEGQVPTLATAELTNLWDRESYSAFVVASGVTVGGTDVPFAEGMRQVVVGPQPQETPINWLNIFYAIEWVVFAGFAFFLWWRLVADDYRRSLEDAADAAEAAQAEGADRRPDASAAVTGAGPSTHASPHPTSDTERSAHSD